MKNTGQDQWNRALVTGASSGIGREIARQLAAGGTDLVVVARNRERLEALADELTTADGVEVEVLVADLAIRTATARVEARLLDHERPVDLLVNNAGFGAGGPFVDNDIDTECSVIEVNVVALTRLAHAAACAMAPRQRGGILNVSSLAGELIAPNSATYSATKAFVTSLSESLHQELAGSGVTVTAVLPGMTRTEFQERAEVDVSDIPDAAWQSAEDVAREGLDALNAGRPRVVTGLINKAADFGARGIPKTALRLVGRAAMSRQNR